MHPSTATEIGIMTALHTGDPVRDLALCVAVPLALDRVRESPHTISTLIASAKERMGDLLAGGRQYTYHTVERIEYGHSSYTNVQSIDEADHGELLFKAVSMYIADHVSLVGQSGRYALFVKPQVDELETALLADSCLALRQRSQIKHALTSNRELTQLSVLPLPPIGQWITLANRVEMQYMEAETDANPDKKRVRAVRKVYTFRSRSDDAPQQIRAFVDAAFEYYTAIEKHKLAEDTKRYLYVRDTTESASTDADDDEDDDHSSAKKSATPYKRYALGEEKTFDTVFFDEKPMVLKLLDDFTNKTGKFAIEGFPNKLGLLLHGPPGTGKTSLIKAIAQYTKRHIVSISLSKIQTNQELLDTMTELRFALRGVSLPVKLTYKDVVFVMEDVDCASSVVKNRAEETSRSDDRDHEVVSDENRMDLLAALFGPDDLFQGRGGLVASSNRNDRLNLAGLLNVLDGVVDSPGRIVIMTTNHPEKLDPALIRPGRVNKKILLSYMPPGQIQNMLEYYFRGSLTHEQAKRLQNLPLSITPAEVEEVCAEYDDVEDAVAALEAWTAQDSDSIM